MKNIGKNFAIGTASVKGSFKLDGKKYETTEKFEALLETLKLDGRTGLFYIDNDGKVAGVTLSGARLIKNIETPRFNGEGTFKADYLVVIGTACNLKEGRPFRFSVATKAEEKSDKPAFYEIKVWDDLVEKVSIELAVPDGEKKPLIWAVARKGVYKDREQYTLEDYGIIPRE